MLDTHQLHLTTGFGYPLAVILGSLFLLVGRFFSINDPVTAINLMGVLFGSLCIPAFYLLAKKLFDELTATIGSVLLSTTPIFLGASVYGMTPAPMLFFLLVGLYYLFAFLKSHCLKHLLISAISLGLMGAIRAQDFILMFIPINFLFLLGTGIFQRKETAGQDKFQAIKHYFIFISLTLLITFSFYIFFSIMNQQTEFNKQFSWYFNLCVNEYIHFFVPQAMLYTMHYLDYTLTSIGLLMGILGLILFGLERNSSFGFLILWFIIPFYFYGNTTITTPRYLVILLPPLFMAIGYLVSRSMKFHRICGMILITGLICIVSIKLQLVYPVLLFRHQHALLPEYAHWVSQKTGKEAMIISSDEATFLKYFGHCRILIRPFNMPSVDPLELEHFKQVLDGFLNKDVPIYITYQGLYSYDPGKLYSNYLLSNYNIDIVGARPSEDWHKGDIFQTVEYYNLYKLSFKKP